MPRHHWTADDVPDQRGRTAVITGASSGIGFATARILAARGATVVLAVRNTDKGSEIRTHIIEESPGAQVAVQHLDLSSLASVRAAASDLRDAYPRIDLLINNAGVVRVDQQSTTDGFEQHFGTNHLGHFALTGLLLDRMLDVPRSRVVTVSSADHRRGGPIPLDDVHWKARNYNRTTAYAHSKLANLMFTYELQRLLAGRGGPLALAAHPGGSDTEGSRETVAAFGPVARVAFALLVRPLLIQSSERGAWPVLRAATDPDAEGAEYYGPSGFMESKGHPQIVRSSQNSHNRDAQRRLWALSEELTKVKFPL
jgi:NAD(P)-dependent dehydrogenase (short-subunit alcohol dehydrogenase family)